VLAREKKWAAWSLAIGAILASAVYLYGVIEARRAAADLQNLIATCEKSPTDKDRHPIVTMRDVKTGKEVAGTLEEKLICAPEELESLDKGTLIPVERQVRDAYDQKPEADVQEYGFIVLLIFCAPIVWYFLLGRIRELSAAIAGRDQH
jgi:hypothetical protein